MNTNKQKNSPTSAERFVFHSHLLLVDAVFSKRVIYSSVFAKEQSAVLSFELETVDFTFARCRSKFTELDSVSVTGMLRSTSNESRGGKFHPLSLFLLSALRASYGKLRFPESSPFGRRSFERIGFQPTCNTIACLQFDHSQRFESTTDRFALQLYGKFNWKYGQIGLLCSLWHFL